MKNIIIFLIAVGLLINFLCTKVIADELAESDVYYLLSGGFIQLELHAYQVFPYQTFSVMVTVKTNQSYDMNTFNVTIELPSGFTLVDGTYSYSNPPINESTNYEWNTTWLINSSDASPGIYTIKATEALLNQKDSDSITVNPGPTPPYNITVMTDKTLYSAGESGVVFAYIFDSNDYPFNLDGICNSTIYYPDGNPTTFFNVPMIFILGSTGEYVSSRGFQAWDDDGIYTVEVNCTNPEGYASNTFEVSVVTTTTPVPPPSLGPGPGPSPGPTPPPPRISNFTVDKDLIKIELKPGEIDEKLIKVSNTGETKLTITGRIQYLDEFSFFTETGTEYMFELSPDETEKLEVNFIAKKDQKPGIHPGKIVFSAGTIERTVLVVVEIESEKPLFDVKVEVLSEYRVVYPGDKIMAQLIVYNLGRIGRVDTDVEYGIKSLDGTVITSEHETMAVETQLSTVKSLNLPPDIKPNSYVFYSIVTYEGIVGTGSSMFSVVEKFKLNITLVIAATILAIIAILIILFVYVFKKKKQKPKKSRKRKK